MAPTFRLKLDHHDSTASAVYSDDVDL